MIISSRWISLIVFILLTLVIAFRFKGTPKEKLHKYGTMFVEGMVGGLIIDAIGISAGYYYFPRQPFLSFEYFAIVIPCWGLFGLLINLLWEWVGQGKFLRGMAVTLLPMLAFYEGYNLYTGSWIYTVPFSVVASGWIPLIIVFAGCNRRRKVVYEIECMMLRTQNKALFNVLSICRYMVIVIMFPLLVTRIYKMIYNLKKLRAMKFKTSDYLEYLMVA